MLKKSLQLQFIKKANIYIIKDSNGFVLWQISTKNLEKNENISKNLQNYFIFLKTMSNFGLLPLLNNKEFQCSNSD